MRQLIFISILLFALTSFGCGGGGSTTASPESVNATGTWGGFYSSTVSGTQAVTINIQQAGSSLTGTFSTTTGATGSVSGTVSGNTATVTITITTQGCNGNLNGTLIINTNNNPDTMSIQYNGSTTCGGQESGTGNLTKQQ